MKRFEIAGFKPSFDANEAATFYRQKATESPRLARRIECILEILVLHHFQLINITDQSGLCREALGYAREYFADDTLAEETGDGWFEPLSNTLLVALFAGDLGELQGLCASLSFDRMPDYVGGLEGEVQFLHLQFAAFISDRLNEFPNDMRIAITSSKRQRPKALSELWDCVLTDDQAEFRRLLKKTVRSFCRRKKPALDATYGSEWIARPQSIITNIAIGKGWQFPDMDDEFKAVLLLNSGTDGEG